MAEDFGLSALLLAPGQHKLANVPEGLEAPLLGKIAAGRVLLYVARDDARMSRLGEALRFFAPQLEVFNFPAWDCLPYDRVSPHRDLSAARIDTLTRLLSPAGAGGRVVLTTLNALTQRVPRPQALAFLVTELKPGTRIAPEALIQLLRQNGYLRNDTVGEPGEFAVRGGLIDLYPAGEAQPIRLDFFGDELEKMRRFDPLTQRSIEEVALFSLKPVSEAQLDPTSIARFRSGYREAFGSVKDDPLYDAISEGRLFPGYEHWLPLFHEGLGLLTDYLPADTALMLEPQINDMLRARLALVEDYYQARLTSLRARQDDGAPYRPLPPKSLYLDAADWKKLQAGRSCLELTPFNEPEALDLAGRRALDLAAARGQGGPAVYEAVKDALSAALSRGERALITGLSDGSRDRLGHMLGEHGIILEPPARDVSDLQSRPLDRAVLATLPFEAGFSGLGYFVLSEADLLGERLSRPSKKKRRAENFLTEVAALSAGDLVVHLDHGIGRYDGLVTLDVMGAAHDCLKVVYAGGDRLFVPVENIEVLSRFGSEGAGVELDKLGGVSWQQRKAEARKRIREIARGLIRIAAERQTKEVEPIELPTGTYEEFAARFPYAETDDQLAAISETFEDLAAGHPMDRLICGDVGFGKTEVALRAAFAVAMSGKQVAVVVPTTLLARQHFRTFKGRFDGLPIKVAQLSRLVAPKDAAEVKEAIKEGTVDIVVGTHALLAKSVEFKRLGLLLVDEEQHFGVKQKERMKELRTEVHVLTLTATPIPRTLQLAMSGVKQMSLISTPPIDRLAVRTFVLPYDPVVVREAIMRERFRGGQIFYVAPRLEDLPDLQQRLANLVPEVKVGVAHGQLSPTALESVMSQFLDGRIDLLLSTNIVESGLDIPNANTLIIHRADMFGLAQLYQLRGRIGRSKQRGYAYLTVPPGRLLTATAAKRLEVMQTLDTLGAGFQLASHDMDIRGAGNLLGEEQSGHIKEVGIELYQQMLEEAVAGLRRKGAESQSQESWSPQINLGMAVLIPEGYVADLDLRLGLYRRLSTLNDASEIEAFGAELIDRFGPLPAEVENLLEIMGVKRLCKMTRVAKVDAGPKGAVFAFRDNRPSDPERLLGYIQRSKGRMKIRPDQRLVVVGDWEAAPERLKGVRQVLQLLAGEGT